MAEAYRVNEPDVAVDILENDVILVHFRSGLYYHLRGLAAEIYKCLNLGHGVGRIAESLSIHFHEPREVVQGDLDALVEGLVKDALFVPAQRVPADVPMTWRASNYEPPVCKKFDDMADQLLLDQIDDPSQNARWTSSEA